MIERVPTYGCSNFIETYTKGFPSLYVGDIERVPISTSTSPLDFHEVDTREREDEELHLQEPHFLAGSLKMSECRIKEALKNLHRTSALMKNTCWKLEEKSSIEYMENF